MRHALAMLPLLNCITCATAATSIPTSSITAFWADTKTIEWHSCPEPLSGILQCASLKVPLNWNDAESRHISLGLARLPAQNVEARIGNLFVNPGGPGISAIEMLTWIDSRNLPVGKEILDRFDIIGIDPRGVGRSTSIKCDPNIWNERVSLFPNSEEDYAALVDHNERLGASCRKMSGDIIDFVDTVSVAKDMEAVRKALGDEPLNWLGLSYGSQIGAQYAELYHENTRAMVFDGNLQHSNSESSNLLTESSAHEAGLGRFFAWCSNDRGCALFGRKLEMIWEELLSQAEEKPVPALGCDDVSCRSDVTAEEIRFKTQALLTYKHRWSELGLALSQASSGDATMFATALVPASGPRSSYNPFADVATSCQDWTHATSSFEQLQEKMLLAASNAPRTKGACQAYRIQTSCIGWPAPVTNPPRQVRVEGGPTILMVNSLYDPSTSYTWAKGLREEIGNAVLLTRNGDGHMSYGLPGETMQTIERYFLEKVLPQDGTLVDS